MYLTKQTFETVGGKISTIFVKINGFIVNREILTDKAELNKAIIV